MSMVVSPFRSNRVTESTIFNKIKAVQSPTKTQEDLLLRIIDSEDISIPDATCCHAYLLLISLFALVGKHENIEKSRNVIEKSPPVSNHVSWADVVRSPSATGSKLIKQ